MLSKEEWLDINNPYLRFLPNADKQIPANNRDFSVNEDYDVLVVPSIDQYGYQKELKSGKIVVVIENDGHHEVMEGEQQYVTMTIAG